VCTPSALDQPRPRIPLFSSLGVAVMGLLTALIIRVVVMGSDDRAGLNRQETMLLDVA
jgi:hypothetical protein